MRWRYPYFISLVVMVLFGSLDMVRGVAAPMMQQDWHLTYFQLSNIFVASAVGYLVGSFLSGLFIQRLGTHWTVVSGALGLALSIILIIKLNAFFSLVLAFGLAGIFTGWEEIGVNHVVPELVVNKSHQSKYFNWLHGFYGAGAFIYPAIAGLLIRMTHSWRIPYTVLLSYGMIVVVLAAVRWTGQLHQKAHANSSTGVQTVEHKHGPHQSKQPLSLSPFLVTLVVSICIYVMAEMGVGSWLTTYLVGARGFSINAGSYVLSGFYLAFTVGRLTAHLWVPRLGDENSVLVSVSLAAILFATALLTKSVPVVSVSAFVLTGFGFAVIFPTIAALASSRFPTQSGQVLGLIFTASGIGSLLTNWLIGWVATSVSLTAGLWLVVGFLVIVLVGAVVMRRIITAEG